jgi:hypothetical protein
VIAQRTEAPIVGYRCWVADRGRLRSATSDDVWPDGVLEARCGDHGSHEAPDPSCGCGIHVCDSPRTVQRYLERRQRWRPWLWRDELVVGAVQLWGSRGRPVIVGEVRTDWRGRGGLQYRAPYARIIALADGPGRAAEIGRALGVPVVRDDYLESYAREHGVQLHPPTPAGEGGWPRHGIVALEVAGVAGPVVWHAVKLLCRLAWWLFKVVWRLAWLVLLVSIQVLGRVLGASAPRRTR